LFESSDKSKLKKTVYCLLQQRGAKAKSYAPVFLFSLKHAKMWVRGIVEVGGR